MTRGKPLNQVDPLYDSCAAFQSVSFTSMREADIKKLSVMAIYNPNAFDSLGNALPGGLYDLKLGPISPKDGSCVTCGLNSTQCIGHIGHIELPFPVVNPVFFDVLFKILKKTCFCCHKFRIRSLVSKTYAVKLSLLRKGLMSDYLELDDLLKTKEYSTPSKCFQLLEKYLNVSLHKRNENNIHCRSIYLNLKKQYLNSINTKPCENCKTSYRKIRRDGYSKIFIESKEKEEKENEDFLSYIDIKEHIKKVYLSEEYICKELWNIENSFFLSNIIVTPSKYRPARILGDMTIEHQQNIPLKKILQLVNEINMNLSINKKNYTNTIIPYWIELQEAVNSYLDSSKLKANDPNPGIKQLLEKKQGLFRMNLMGKRVNYAARSVITPDPYIETNEIGIPVKLARKLTFCENVTDYNCERLMKNIINGVNKHPGALFVEMPDGKKVDLSKLNEDKRKRLAIEISEFKNGLFGLTQNTLYSNYKTDFEDIDSVFKYITKKNQYYKVYRHINNNDYVIANRQPTLHKPSIMGHKVRVLDNEQLQTIRIHYTNCEAYNADFDGDEINVHFPQSYQAQAEIEQLVFTDQNYNSNTDGSPLRGLIQDHVDMGVILTKQDTFLTKQEFTQMVTIACISVDTVILPIAAVLKPQQLYTGKQVITTILMNILEKESLTYGPGKTKTPATVWNIKYSDKFLSQSVVIFREGVMCTGILDKAQFGASTFGFVHAVAEIYGNTKAGILLSSLGRLFTFCSQFYSHSCCMEDLLLTSNTEEYRKQALVNANVEGIELGKKENEQQLDRKMQVFASKVTSNIISECLPKGQRTSFPNNCLARMVNSGAKGSRVNHSQISALLGQQTLEGKRVPKMTSTDKTLPCFLRDDLTPRSGGFISQRFLTGLKPQEYYFHCMAGREGLVDTAVKTSRSGYLQRSLIKALEPYSVHYDQTVRADDGGIVQFIYGEDGLDTLKSFFLNGSEETLKFLYNNAIPLCTTLHIGKEEGKINLDKEDEDDSDEEGEYFDNHIISNLQSTLLLNKSTRHSYSLYKKLIQGTKIEENEFSLEQLQEIISTAGLKKGIIVTVVHNKSFHKAKITKIKKLDITKLAHLSLKNLYQTVSKLAAPTVNVKLLSTKETVKNIKVFEERLIENEVFKAFLVEPCIPDPIPSLLSPTERFNSLGVTSEFLNSRVQEVLKKNSDMEEELLTQLVALKLMKNQVAVGENVGTIAGQSIGEPSTQMTLNTFHLAGTGGGNVTLGIPRMRELLMTASKTIKTPNMRLPLVEGLSLKQIQRFRALFTRTRLEEVVEKVEVVERFNEDYREYIVRLHYFQEKEIKQFFKLGLENISRKVCNAFTRRLLTNLTAELKRGGEKISSKKALAVVSPVLEKPNVEEEENFSEVESVDEEEEEEEFEGTSDSSDGEEAEETVSEEPQLKPQSAKKAKIMKRKRNEVYLSPDNLVAGHFAFSKMSYISQTGSNSALEVTLRLDSATKRVLMLGLAESAVESTIVRQISDILKCYEIDEETLGLDGCNFNAVWLKGDKVVDLNKISTNDVNAMLETYGVEAARATIIKEIQNVFGVYGIDVDFRHLSLVADAMTYRGGYDGFNRGAMKGRTVSSLLQMSFEQTGAFVKEATVDEMRDDLKTPSALIATGALFKHGTGCFDVFAE